MSGSVPFEFQLNSKLARATDINNTAINIEAIKEFCDMVVDTDGSKIAVVLIIKKLFSSNEWEVLQTLKLISMCAEKCGPVFQQEIGMFRFINNLLKLIFPKYMGNQTSEKVKFEVCKLLYDWSKKQPHSKFGQAFETLKLQNLLPQSFLNLYEEKTTTYDSQSSLNVDTYTSKKLTGLLQSSNPEDVRHANLMIKSLLKEDELKKHRKLAQKAELEYINSNIALLNEMIFNFDIATSNNPEDLNLIKEIYETCISKKSTLTSMINDNSSTDIEDILGDIISTYECLTKCIEEYEHFFQSYQRKTSLKNGKESHSNKITNNASVKNNNASQIKNNPNFILPSNIVLDNTENLNSVSKSETSLPLNHQNAMSSSEKSFAKSNESFFSDDDAQLLDFDRKEDFINEATSDPLITIDNSPLKITNEMKQMSLDNDIHDFSDGQKIFDSKKSIIPTQVNIFDEIKLDTPDEKINEEVLYLSDSNPPKNKSINSNRKSNYMLKNAFDTFIKHEIDPSQYEIDDKFDQLSIFDKENIKIILCKFKKECNIEYNGVTLEFHYFLLSIINTNKQSLTLNIDCNAQNFRAQPVKDVLVKIHPKTLSLPGFNPIAPITKSLTMYIAFVHPDHSLEHSINFKTNSTLTKNTNFYNIYLELIFDNNSKERINNNILLPHTLIF